MVMDKSSQIRLTTRFAIKTDFVEIAKELWPAVEANSFGCSVVVD